MTDASPRPLASEEAIGALGRQIKLSELLGGDALLLITPQHGVELFRELYYWRKQAGVLDEDEPEVTDQASGAKGRKEDGDSKGRN